MNKKLLQIDSCLGVLSTGRITESIAKLAIVQGWECHIMHGARYLGNSIQHHYQVSSLLGEYIHNAESMLLDRHGLGSRQATKRIIEKIKEIKPDVVHLHCVHGYYINYKYLFEYLNQTDIPIVWTFHDCWAFTGHCTYFDKINCLKWQTKCYECDLLSDYPKSLFRDRSEKNYKLKKKLFTNIKNLTIVSVSNWLENLVKQSFFCNSKIITIHNGVDLTTFRPIIQSKLVQNLNLEQKNIILGVAAVWDERKGLEDFIQLSRILDDNFKIVLVGLNERQIKQIPPEIIGIPKTNNATELAELYTAAMVFVNPTWEDNFPTTNLESLACGTPLVTYRTGGSVEAVSHDTGYIIEKGDIPELIKVIKNVKEKGKQSFSIACRKRAVEFFNKEDRFKEYLDLYETILSNA
jgi:putative colanic acid biosynthesis glycosyltransferase